MKLISEKLAGRALGFLIAYTALSSVVRAASKLFWCDEVITVALARLPTLATVRDALEHAADSHPPPFYWVERMAAHLPLRETITYRIPSILAYSATLLCVFIFVKKRRGSTFALICAIVSMATVLYSNYAVEARGYSLMAGCVALAMVCYQRADKTVWWVIMGLSLAAAQSMHYYAIFAMFLFGLAELAFLANVRRARWGVWLALMFGALPLAIFWPLLQNLKIYYGAHFSGHLSMDQTMRSYGWLFDLPPTYGVGVAFTAAAAVLLYGFLVPQDTGLDEIPPHEHVLALSFLTLPLVMYVTLRLVHGGFNPRYLLLTGLGFPLAASYVLPPLDRRLIALFSILLITYLGAQEAVFWRFQLYLLRNHFSQTAEVERLLATAGHSGLPLVDSDALDYLPLAYYASPELYRRTFFLADVSAALTYTGSDSADKCVLALRRYMKLQVSEFQEFSTTHPEFLLYSDGRPVWDWQPARLFHDGYALEVVAMNAGHRIYLARKNR